MAGKYIRLFILLLAVAAGLMLWQGRHGSIGPSGPLTSAVALINESLSSAVDYTGSVVRRVFGRPGDLQKAQAELDRLRIERMRDADLQAENKRLREILELRDNTPSYVASARVIARGTDRWANSLVIDKGTSSGVQKDMAVITPRGLIGKVQEARQNASLVLLIDDPRFGASVRIATSRIEAVLSGTGRGRCVLKYADIDTVLASGEVVITSGLDGVFPFGIPIGEVAGVATSGQDEFFQHVEVRPFTNPRAVEEVMVVGR